MQQNILKTGCGIRGNGSFFWFDWNLTSAIVLVCMLFCFPTVDDSTKTTSDNDRLHPEPHWFELHQTGGSDEAVGSRDVSSRTAGHQRRGESANGGSNQD